MDLAQLVKTLGALIWETPTQLPWLVVLLLGTGLFVTLRLGFIQLRKVVHAIRVVAGHYDDPDDDGDVSHFQALSTALSATVGIGNIAGVAIAIHVGGPGAVFWMWLTAFFGMALKYSECTLALQYRVFDDEGYAAGGPMYYIERGLGPRWKPLAVLFAGAAAICSFATGNMNQANTVALSAWTDFQFPEWIVGLVLAFSVALVILGGIRRIAAISAALAPTMAIVYVVAALTILLLNASAVPDAFLTIITSAFSPAAGVAGSVSGALQVTLLFGVKRGLFSNEAGQGSAPIAHAAAKTKEPVREGAVAMLEPLIDTLIICTMTALVIITTGVWDSKYSDELQLRKVEPVPTRLFPTEGTAFERIKSAREAFEIAVKTESAEKAESEVDEADRTPASMQVTFSDGVPADMMLLTRNATISGALTLLTNNATISGALLSLDGKPFSGVLTYQPADASWASPNLKDKEVDRLLVTGKMLKTSSALTAEAFRQGLSPILPFGNYIVTICVFLFGLSTIISWSYYGDRSVTYLFGAAWVRPYRFVYVVFTFLGANLALQSVWDFGDLCLGVMSVPNLIAVLLLSPRIVEITKAYFDKFKDA